MWKQWAELAGVGGAGGGGTQRGQVADPFSPLPRPKGRRTGAGSADMRGMTVILAVAPGTTIGGDGTAASRRRETGVTARSDHATPEGALRPPPAFLHTLSIHSTSSPRWWRVWALCAPKTGVRGPGLVRRPAVRERRTGRDRSGPGRRFSAMNPAARRNRVAGRRQSRQGRPAVRVSRAVCTCPPSSRRRRRTCPR